MTDTAKVDRSISVREEGFKAYGAYVFECPYAMGTEDWMTWTDGWLDGWWDDRPTEPFEVDLRGGE